METDNYITAIRYTLPTIPPTVLGLNDGATYRNGIYGVTLADGLGKVAESTLSVYSSDTDTLTTGKIYSDHTKGYVGITFGSIPKTSVIQAAVTVFKFSQPINIYSNTASNPAQNSAVEHPVIYLRSESDNPITNIKIVNSRNVDITQYLIITPTYDNNTNVWTYKIDTSAVPGNAAAIACKAVLPNGTQSNLSLNVTPEEGYKFIGWATSETGAVVILAEAGPFGDNGIYGYGDVTYYAVWQSSGYELSYELREPTGAASPSAYPPVSLDAGNNLKIPQGPTLTGYEFDGWYYLGSGSVEQEATTAVTMPAANLVVYAKWRVKQYNVTFDTATNGTILSGTPTMSVDYNQYIASGDVPTIAPNSGFIFIGWKSSDTGGIYDAAAIQASHPITSAVTFTAQYIDLTKATVIFEYNGGTVAGSDVPYRTISDDGGNPYSDVLKPIRTGYVFTGWTPDPVDAPLPSEDTNTDTFYGTLGGVGTVTIYTAQWRSQSLTVTFNAGANGTMNPASYSEPVSYNGKVTSVPNIKANSSYTFLGWSMNDGSSYYSDADILAMTITGDTNFVAKYQQTTVTGGSGGSSGGGSTNYAVTFDTNGSSSINAVTAGSGTKIDLSGYAPTRTGYSFDGWHTDAELTKKVTEVTLYSNITVYAKWKKLEGINKEDHFAYMQGYPDGLFIAEANMTRAEAAQMIYNLLLDTSYNTPVSFSDVPSSAWHYKAITALSAKGIINGYPDDTFKPDAPITRAEFVTILSRFSDISGGGMSFADVTSNHWAYTYITSASSKGWISGYPDGTFRPAQNISRAEAAKATNALLERNADKSYVDANPSINRFPDVSGIHWGYYEIMEVTVAHDYTKDVDGLETWTAIR